MNAMNGLIFNTDNYSLSSLDHIIRYILLIVISIIFVECSTSNYDLGCIITAAWFR